MMQLGFSSMGQPELSLEECENLAIECGADFLELRVLEGSLDLPAYFQSRETKNSRVPVRLLASSLRLAEASEADFTDFATFGDLAHRMEVPFVRIFGGGREGHSLTEQELNEAVSAANRVREMIKDHQWGFEPLLETHDAFSSSSQILALDRFLDRPLSILWDSHHTWKLAGESLQESWAHLGPRIRHIHYKDSVTEGEAFRYVLPGKGQFPTQQLFDLLRNEGYEEGVSLEWEKLWHPELPPLKEAIPPFLSLSRETLI